MDATEVNGLFGKAAEEQQTEEQQTDETQEQEQEEEQQAEADVEDESEGDTEEQPEEESEGQAEDDYLGTLDSRMESLETQLKNLADTLGKERATEEKQEEQPVKEEEKAIEFVTDEEAENLIADPAKLNEALNKVYRKAYEEARQAIRTEAPNIVREERRMEQEAAEQARWFWNEHSYLLEGAETEAAKNRVYRAVEVTANRLAAEHPAWGFKELAEATANEIAMLRGIDKKQGARGSKKNKARFAKSKSKSSEQKARVEEPEPSEEQKKQEEIKNLFKRH